ncbi:MAG: pentapeptide repeat-containing protein [Nostocales cyanobacterium 94392]|nr:pentapeptide repeat-containing protein [Nostocales cyanobacterium 94392]
MDYSGQNLQGKSFKGQNLTNADFSDADIRGANFTNAILTGANFSRAKAGLQKRQAIFLVFVSWLLVGISGFLFAFNGHLALLIFKSSTLENQVAGWVVILTLIIFFLVIVCQGTKATLIAGTLSGSVAVAGALTVAVAGTGTGALTVAGSVAGTGALAVAVAVAVALAVALALALDVVLAIAVAGAVTVAGAISGAIISEAISGATSEAISGSVALVCAGSVASSYIGWRAIKGDKKHAIIRNYAVAFAAFGGTSFRNADLTDTNFTLANLKNSDFRNAILTRTCFRKVKKLDFVRPGNTYLKSYQLLELLVTGNGREKNFDREDLRGINLRGADLVDSSFITADLSTANLQDSDLSRAKLVQTQLDATDFTGATLTGAYIEDWNITTHTNFTGVRCEYVYMRLPTKDNPEPLRKPDNREEVFGDGEFGDFIKPIVDTLDLYHNQGVDPRAIAIAFKELAEKNPEANLEIVAMEKRGEDKFLLRAKVAPETKKSELSQQYFESYNHLKTLSPEEQIQHYLNQISEKDEKIEGLQQKYISSLENMVGTALGRPTMQVDNFNNQGDMMSEKETANYNLDRAKFGGGFAGTGGSQSSGNLGDYSTNNIQSQQSSLVMIVCSKCSHKNPHHFKCCSECGMKLM